jgi:GntR family transcriptional regulator, transcriptional repressor for pyruvate dehydrogenase complex
MVAVPNSASVANARPLRRTNLPIGIADRMRRDIVQRELTPGTRLPGHRELAAAYSVSVGSVREAISMLVSAGLVETRAGRGTYVSDGVVREVAALPAHPLTREEAEELIEAREVIEVQVAALAAERATPEQVAELRRHIERMDAASADPADYPDADVEFHIALATTAANRYLLRAMLDIRALLRQDMVLGAEAAIRRFGDLRPSVESHRRIVDAVEAHDARAARQATGEMVRRNQMFVLGLYALASSETVEAHDGLE